jgi:transcriptional regulator with XRE-family HTH domain
MQSSVDLLIKFVGSALQAEATTKAEILRRTGFSASQLDAYLSKKSTPGLDAADRLAAALKTTLAHILFGTEGRELANLALEAKHQVDDISRNLKKTQESLTQAQALAEDGLKAIESAIAKEGKKSPIPPEFNELVPQFALLRGERLEYIVRICQAIVNFDDPKLKRVDDLCDEIILGKPNVKEEVKKQA